MCLHVMFLLHNLFQILWGDLNCLAPYNLYQLWKRVQVFANPNEGKQTSEICDLNILNINLSTYSNKYFLHFLLGLVCTFSIHALITLFFKTGSGQKGLESTGATLVGRLLLCHVDRPEKKMVMFFTKSWFVAEKYNY